MKPSVGVGVADAVGTIAPWIQTQRALLLAQQGHAWLLHGPAGLGQFTLAMELASAWLCTSGAGGACGHCASCHAIAVHTHADLLVVLPEVAALRMGWPLPERAQLELDEKKRKPSKEIRVEALRQVVEFAQRTSARGRGKVVLIYPAELMNSIAANTLLKTLEEPPGDLRFVLASDAAHLLLPTIRSRCQAHAMHWPDDQAAIAWLLGEGLGLDPATARALLSAMGGQPEAVCDYVRSGGRATQWAQVPRAVHAGDVLFFKDWSAPQLLDALQKLAHDLMGLAFDAQPRFFSRQDLVSIRADFQSLSHWCKALLQARRHVEHPFSAALQLDALVLEAQSALHSGPSGKS